jgi:hypothetical protein
VTIQITDAEGGFHLSIDVQPPLPTDGTVPEPSGALIAGMVARRAIEQLVQENVSRGDPAQIEGGNRKGIQWGIEGGSHEAN